MRRRHLFALPLLMLALFALSGTALAGGWATVTMADPPSDITPGDETTLEMTVLQHGATPVDWPKITVIAANADTGAIVRVEAKAVAGKLGSYQAQITFPTDGDWAIAYDSPDLVMDGSATLAVAAAPPVVAAPIAPAQGAVEPAAAAAATAPSSLSVPAALATLALTVVVAVLATVLIRRRTASIEHGEPAAS